MTLYKGFAKYLIVAVSVTLLNIASMWLIIDILHTPTFIGSSIVVASMFVIKFYSYVLIKLMKSSFKNFMKYASVNIISALLNIVLVWFLIEIFGIPTVISSAAVVFTLFIARFIMFKKVDLIE